MLCDIKYIYFAKIVDWYDDGIHLAIGCYRYIHVYSHSYDIVNFIFKSMTADEWYQLLMMEDAMKPRSHSNSLMKQTAVFNAIN